MKSKLLLVLGVVFLIAVIYNTIQIFQYGITSVSLRFWVDYILNFVGFIAMCFFYNHCKNK